MSNTSQPLLICGLVARLNHISLSFIQKVSDEVEVEVEVSKICLAKYTVKEM